MTDENPWARIRFEIHRLAGLIAELFDTADRAEHRIEHLEQRVDRIERTKRIDKRNDVPP